MVLINNAEVNILGSYPLHLYLFLHDRILQPKWLNKGIEHFSLLYADTQTAFLNTWLATTPVSID